MDKLFLFYVENFVIALTLHQLFTPDAINRLHVMFTMRPTVTLSYKVGDIFHRRILTVLRAMSEHLRWVSLVLQLTFTFLSCATYRVHGFASTAF